MKNKKRIILFRIYFIISIILLLIFILGLIASMSEFLSSKIVGIIQFLALIAFSIYIFKKRNFFKYERLQSFLRLESDINGFSTKMILISLFNITIFITILFFSLFTLRYFLHLYDKSIPGKTMVEMKRAIEKNLIELDNTLIDIDTLKSSNMFDSLLKVDSKYNYVFYTKNNGIKTIIDTNYMLKSLKAFSGSIHLDDYMFGNNYTKKLGVLNEDDLKKIAEGYLNGSIIVRHHENFSIKNFEKWTRVLSILSYPSCDYFTYKKNDYIIYDIYNESNKQNGLHSSAFPLTSEDYKKTLSELSAQLNRIKKQ